MSRRIKHSLGIAGFETPDLYDFAILDADVGLITRDSRAVDNHPVFDDGVEFRHDSHLLRLTWGPHNRSGVAPVSISGTASESKAN
jgi:hypothetical protein